jgi:hypothetical protein
MLRIKVTTDHKDSEMRISTAWRRKLKHQAVSQNTQPLESSFKAMSPLAVENSIMVLGELLRRQGWDD